MTSNGRQGGGQWRLLRSQLRWFIGLRWLAGATVTIGASVDWHWLSWHAQVPGMIVVGLAILAYNAVLAAVIARPTASAERTGRVLMASAWAQILLDLSCLTLLTLWTGGLGSPLIGFYVFHMVFASLLTPHFVAYGAATAAMVMVCGGAWLSRQWPQGLDGWLTLLGWLVTLLLTVFLTNHITRSLRRQQRRLLRQNRRINRMSRRLQLQQQAMIQHEKMAAMGRMAAGVAHEISNPLSSMDSVLQLMQRRPDRPRPDAVETIRHQADRIRQIVEQMTAYAHPSDTRWQTLGPHELTEQALRMVQFDRRLRRVKVDKRFDSAAPAVYVQAQAIEQTLVNLMLNALDAMRDVDEPKLTLRTGVDGPWSIIEVADNGHGIDPADRPRLFEPFFTTKPVGKGTGLGLSISYNLVDRCGGRIDVSGEPGRGATFTVRLPAADARSQKQEPMAANSPGGENG